MAKKDLVKSLQDTIDTIQDALDKGADKAAFFCALSIPDICAQIEYSNSKLKNMTVGERYSKWYDEKFYAYENSPVGMPMNQLNGDVAYIIRCKMYHEGEILHKETLKKLNKNYNELVDEDDVLTGREINFKLEFISEEVERFYVNYQSDMFNQPIGPISINAYISPKNLAEKLMWTAEGVIRNFNKKNA